MNNRIKCTIVGDGGVGKTAMLISYSSNQFAGNYEPTVFDNYMMKVHVGDEQYEIGFFDMAGQCDYDRLRVLSYPNTNVFILCFSVVNPTSYENIESKWLPEIQRHYSRAPIVLVGTQIDLRNDPESLEKLFKSKKRPIAYEEGFQLARQIGAVKYTECSSLTQRGLKNVFDEAIMSALTPATPPPYPRRKKWYSCTLSCILPN